MVAWYSEWLASSFHLKALVEKTNLIWIPYDEDLKEFI
jgi:hypothetical protein